MDSYELYASHTSTQLAANKPHDFIIQLNRTLELNENSTIEILGWSFDSPKKKTRKPLFIFSDVVTNSFLLGVEQPVIGVIYPSNKKAEQCYLPNTIKIKTISGSINRLHLYIRDGKLSDSSVDFSELLLTLRFKNVCVK